jgi:hypothetical protein
MVWNHAGGNSDELGWFWRESRAISRVSGTKNIWNITMDTAVKQCTQALINCGVTGCFISIEWAQSNNIPIHSLTNLIPVYNIDGTANEAGMINEIANLVLCYENQSEHTQFAVTPLGK